MLYKKLDKFYENNEFYKPFKEFYETKFLTPEYYKEYYSMDDKFETDIEKMNNVSIWKTLLYLEKNKLPIIKVDYLRTELIGYDCLSCLEEYPNFCNILKSLSFEDDEEEFGYKITLFERFLLLIMYLQFHYVRDKAPIYKSNFNKDIFKEYMKIYSYDVVSLLEEEDDEFAHKINFTPIFKSLNKNDDDLKNTDTYKHFIENYYNKDEKIRNNWKFIDNTRTIIRKDAYLRAGSRKELILKNNKRWDLNLKHYQLLMNVYIEMNLGQNQYQINVDKEIEKFEIRKKISFNYDNSKFYDHVKLF